MLVCDKCKPKFRQAPRGIKMFKCHECKERKPTGIRPKPKLCPQCCVKLQHCALCNKPLN